MQYFAAATRTRMAGVLLACAALVVSGLQLASAPDAAARLAPKTYSDPIWFPVHDMTTRLGCVGNLYGNNNGQTGSGQACATDHKGYWGMNITSLGGVADNPGVYAAGAGIVQSVTDPIEPACGPDGEHGDGNTVVVEHGGGVVSVYEHLKTINVTAGQQVYANTLLGLMGASGQPCQGDGNPVNAYLNFQIRVMGGAYLTATTTQIRALRGCTGASTSSALWPAGLGLPGAPKVWSDVPYDTQLDTSGQGRCYPGPSWVDGTPNQPARPAVRAGDGRVTVAWTAVTGANRYLVQAELYSKTRGWVAPCSPYQDKGCTVGYTGVRSTAHRTSVTGLTNGRDYRIRLSVHNRTGWSPASRWVAVTPQAAPDAPTLHRLTSGRHAVALSWTLLTNDLNGATLRGFQVGIDHLRGGQWTRFVFDRTGDTNHYLWTGLARHTTYRVLVRAVTTTGYGYWMHAQSIRTT